MVEKISRQVDLSQVDMYESYKEKIAATSNPLELQTLQTELKLAYEASKISQEEYLALLEKIRKRTAPAAT